MSKIQVDSIVNKDDTGGVDFPKGVTVTGVVTATSFAGNVTGDVTGNVTGDITIGAGSTSAPSLAPSGDSNTGVFFPSADTIAFAEGGAEAARIDISGRLLVGSTSSVGAGSGQYAKLQIGASTFGSTSGGKISIQRGQAASDISSGSEIGQLVFSDNAGGDYAFITVRSDAAGGSSDYPGRIEFSTTADGAAAPTERMRITQAGFTKMFTTSVHSVPGQYHEIGNKKNVSGDISLVILLGGSNTNNTSSYFLKCGDDVDDRLYIYGNGNVVNSNNSYGAKSDAKLKENIVDANSQWSDIKSLQVRNYNFKEGQTHTQIGLVAQEVELVSPGLVNESPDRDEDGNDLGTTTKSVNYSVLYMKSVKALQEAQTRIEELEAQNTAILARLDALEAG
jgi:hypothetical protein